MRAPALLLLVVATLASCAPARQGLRVGYDVAMDAQHAVVDALGPGRERPPLPPGVRAVEVLAGLSYVVDVQGGVVVVDCGLDPAPRALLEAIGDRPVRAVLLTHAHVDHDAGCAALRAPLYVGRGDVERLHRRQKTGAPFPHVGDALVGATDVPDVVVPVDDGAVIEVGGARFVAVALPGHTKGSTAYVLGDAAFTGDAIVNLTGDGLSPSPFTVNDDGRAAARALRRLRGHGVRLVLDSHFGATDDAGEELQRAIARLRRDEESFAVPWSR